MSRHTAAGLLLVGTMLLAGCAVGADLTARNTSPIFDRARVSADELPAEMDANVDADTSRYAGKDSAGNGYWAVHATDSVNECIVYVPADDNDYFVFCGGLGFSATTNDGRVIEFASSPRDLSPDDAELVGDTFLVKAPR